MQFPKFEGKEDNIETAQKERNDEDWDGGRQYSDSPDLNQKVKQRFIDEGSLQITMPAPKILQQPFRTNVMDYTIS